MRKEGHGFEFLQDLVSLVDKGPPEQRRVRALPGAAGESYKWALLLNLVYLLWRERESINRGLTSLRI